MALLFRSIIPTAYSKASVARVKLNASCGVREIDPPILASSEPNYTTTTTDVFNVVRKAEKLILEKGENKEYIPVDGLAAFNKAAAELLLGADNDLLKKDKGFASGNFDSDAESVRMFGARGMDVIVAQSYSKNMGLYAERIGALSFMCSSSQTSTRVKSQLKWLITGMYAFPPVHGARIVSTVANNPDLLNEWKEHIATMATSIKSARKTLYKRLVAKEKSNKDWSFILNQLGMFLYPGLNKAQREHIERKWHVDMTKDGSISLAEMSSQICDYVADAIIDSYHSINGD